MISKNHKKWALALLIVGVCVALYSQPVLGQSSNVALIDGPSVINGGAFPTNSNPDPAFSAFSFTNLPVANVNATNLALYDTVLLNVASPGMACNINNLSATQKADLVSFVAAGNKLIIYDSECPPQDYSWLPYPFTTANPGAQGEQGTLTIVEDNTLSTLVDDPDCSSLDPLCINATLLGDFTDAVGDMNVMTTLDPNWCVDMSGTNTLDITGPVHTYANYPSGTDNGLIIYNGLDLDYLGPFIPPDNTNNRGNLAKIWLQELQQPFAPSGLPCRVTVVGITLEPDGAVNDVGEDHTVTATLTDLVGNAQPGIPVTFSVVSGPNSGASGTCSVNADCTTDANGEVSFTYTGAAGVGIDNIEACFTNQAGDEVCSQVVTKEWLNTPPDCSEAYADPDCLWPPNHKFVDIAVMGVTDPDGDPVTIEISSITSDEPTATDEGSGGAKHAPDASGLDTDTASLRSERSGNEDGRVYTINFTATDDKNGMCSGSVVVNVPHDQSDKTCPAVDTGQDYDATDIN